MFAPPQHVAVVIKQNIGLERIASVGVRQPNLRHGGGHRRDAARREFAHQGQQGRLVHGLFNRDFEVGTHGGIDRFLVHERSRVALNGCEGDDGQGQQHDDGEAIHGFGRARAFEAALHVVQQRRAAKDDLHDLRPFGPDSPKQERPANPQSKGPEDVDEALKEEVRDDAVFAAVGFQPCIANSEHAEQESQPVQPTLRLGGLGRFSNALFDFKFNELTSTASSKDERQS